MTSALVELITEVSTIRSLVMSLCSATLLWQFLSLLGRISSSGENQEISIRQGKDENISTPQARIREKRTSPHEGLKSRSLQINLRNSVGWMSLGVTNSIRQQDSTHTRDILIIRQHQHYHHYCHYYQQHHCLHRQHQHQHHNHH